MDERHGQPSGPVLKKLCERAYQRFGQADYRRLAGISVSHLYNLRASKTYQRQRCILTKTRPKAASIGPPSGESPAPITNRGISALTQSIKVTRTSAKGFTTSMPWMR